MMTNRALYIGRFNPFHNGHLYSLEYILDQDDVSELIVAIGSAQESYSLTNPFTAGERFEMITTIVPDLLSKFKKNITIVPIIDINNNNQWIAYLTSLLPSFQTIYSNNSLVKLLCQNFSTLNYKPIPLKNRNNWSSTTIREKMIKNSNWAVDLPRNVADYIIHIQGDIRLRNLSSNDT